MDDYPFVTAMIVARNEEKYIGKCFNSLLQQSYPANKYEVLIIDGLSEDRTIDIAKEIEAKYSGTDTNDNSRGTVKVRYLQNPKKLLAAGWNLGIREARGDYVVRIDAHGYADEHFLLKSVQTMLDIGDAVCVGGSMRTEALSERGKVIASVLSSPFGVGNSKFRYSRKPQYVDTVAFGLYKKEIFDVVGYFDETLARNQDNDMHRRIRESGGKFYLNPEIKSTYHPRETLRSMMKQAYNNGKWNIITFLKNRQSVSLRHLMPMFFVKGTVGCLLLGAFNSFWWQALFVTLIFYVILGFVFALRRTKKIRNLAVMPILFFLLHFSYGIGSSISVFQQFVLFFEKDNRERFNDTRIG
jgi:glycosyltransferase involved in cell wall biosynthesis